MFKGSHSSDCKTISMHLPCCVYIVSIFAYSFHCPPKLSPAPARQRAGGEHDDRPRPASSSILEYLFYILYHSRANFGLSTFRRWTFGENACHPERSEGSSSPGEELQQASQLLLTGRCSAF